MAVIEIHDPVTGRVVAREADAGYIEFANGTTLRCDRAAQVTDPIAIRVDGQVLLELRRWPGNLISFDLCCSEAVAHRMMLPPPDSVTRRLPKAWLYD